MTFHPFSANLRAREVNESWAVWESVQSLFLADTDELIY